MSLRPGKIKRLVLFGLLVVIGLGVALWVGCSKSTKPNPKVVILPTGWAAYEVLSSGVILAGHTTAGMMGGFDMEGRNLWRVGVFSPHFTMPSLLDGNVFAYAPDNKEGRTQIAKIGKGGTVMWQLEMPTRVNSWPVGSKVGGIYCIGNDDNLYCISPEGVISWTSPVGPQENPRMGVFPDGTVVTASSDGTVIATGSNGLKLWEHGLPGPTFPSEIVITESGALFASGEQEANCQITALSKSGEELWQYNSPSPYLTRLMEGADGLVYFGITMDEFLSIDQFGSLQPGRKFDLEYSQSFRIDSKGNATVLRSRGDPVNGQIQRMWIEFYTEDNVSLWEYEIDNFPLGGEVYLPELGKTGDSYVAYDNTLLVFSPSRLVHN